MLPGPVHRSAASLAGPQYHAHCTRALQGTSPQLSPASKCSKLQQKLIVCQHSSYKLGYSECNITLLHHRSALSSLVLPSDMSDTIAVHQALLVQTSTTQLQISCNHTVPAAQYSSRDQDTPISMREQ